MNQLFLCKEEFKKCRVHSVHLKTYLCQGQQKGSEAQDSEDIHQGQDQQKVE